MDHINHLTCKADNVFFKEYGAPFVTHGIATRSLPPKPSVQHLEDKEQKAHDEFDFDGELSEEDSETEETVSNDQLDDWRALERSPPRGLSPAPGVQVSLLPVPEEGARSPLLLGPADPLAGDKCDLV